MTISKHTEGPWEVEKDGITVRQKRARDRQKICRPMEVFMSRLEREANARLIAAAPELLEVCKLLVQAADSLAMTANLGTADDAIGKARATIAKAEGTA